MDSLEQFRKKEIYKEFYKIIEQNSLDSFNLFISFLKEDSFEFIKKKLLKNSELIKSDLKLQRNKENVNGYYFKWIKSHCNDHKLEIEDD